MHTQRTHSFQTGCSTKCCSSKRTCTASSVPCTSPFDACVSRDSDLLTCTVPTCPATAVVPCASRVAGWMGSACTRWTDDAAVTTCSGGVCGSTADFSVCSGARTELASCADARCRDVSACVANSLSALVSSVASVCFVDGSGGTCQAGMQCGSNGACKPSEVIFD